MFLLDIGPIIMGPTGVHVATLLGFPNGWNLLLVGFVLSYLINLVLAAAVLHFARKDYKKDLKNFLLVILATTTAIFLVEFLDVLVGIISALAMYLIYKFVFTKEFELNGKQAATGAIAFAILTNPFVYFVLASPYYDYYHYGVQVNAKESIQGMIKEVFSTGYGIEFRDKVEFSPGSVINKKDALGEAPLTEDEVHFACADHSENTCGPDDKTPITLAGDASVTANKQTTASIAVCVGDEQKYFVIISSSGTEGLDKAEQKAYELCKIS